MQEANLTKREIISLRWIIRMRWLAAAGQLLGAVGAQVFFGVVIPWWPVGSVVLLTLCSNFAFLRFPSSVLSGFPLWLDILLLTLLIFFTGGPHNPFTSFYLLHIALGAMTVRTVNLWALVAACVGCYVFLFFHHHPVRLGNLEISQGCASYSWHLQGMLIAFIFTAFFIALFVSRMHAVLLQQDEELSEAREEAQRHARFASLATLAAGVAHEMGSPLATISLASSELLLSLESTASPTGAADDARLIHQETQRCRAILDRLNQSNTNGLGEAPLACTMDQIWQHARAGLPEVISQRIRFFDHARGATVRLPRDSIAQALAILLQNAHQADTTGAPIELLAFGDQGSWRWEVRDRGPEPSAEVMERATDPFFTTKETGQGLGLGLFLVKSLALRLAGDFRLTRSKDGWTVATLSIPSASSNSEQGGGK